MHVYQFLNRYMKTCIDLKKQYILPVWMRLFTTPVCELWITILIPLRRAEGVKMVISCLYIKRLSRGQGSLTLISFWSPSNFHVNVCFCSCLAPHPCTSFSSSHLSTFPILFIFMLRVYFLSYLCICTPFPSHVLFSISLHFFNSTVLRSTFLLYVYPVLPFIACYTVIFL